MIKQNKANEMLVYTVNSEIEAGVLFPRNFAGAKFRVN